MQSGINLNFVPPYHGLPEWFRGHSTFPAKSKQTKCFWDHQENYILININTSDYCINQGDQYLKNSAGNVVVKLQYIVISVNLTRVMIYPKQDPI